LTESELLIDFENVTSSVYPQVILEASAPPAITELSPHTKHKITSGRLERRVAVLEDGFVLIASGLIALAVVALKRS
jgi:hypothetical protein